MTYNKKILICVLISTTILLLLCYNKKKCKSKLENFSLSKKPMEADNTLLHMNPFDNIDYITPYYIKN